jgi:hypothetical protein
VIANRGYGRWRGKASFADCVDYVTRENELERPLAVWSDGLASIETSALEMEAVASQSKADEPLYHLIVSWGPDERPSMERVREALEMQLDALGFRGLQYVAAIHDDGEGGKVHLHAVINRVDPVSLRARSPWRDRVKMRQACREYEVADGWRNVGAEPALSGVVGTDGNDQEQSSGNSADDPGRVKHGRAGSASDPYGVRERFRDWVNEAVRPRLEALLERADSTWETLAAVLEEDGLRYEVVSSFGARIVGVISGFAVKLTDVGLSHLRFVDRFGEWLDAQAPDRQSRDEAFAEKIDFARSAVEGMDATAGWAGVHDVFGRFGLGLEKNMNGLRVVDLDGPVWQRVDKNDSILSMRSLVERFGPYESTADEKSRAEVREAVRQAENLIVGKRLERDPSPIFTTLLHTKSVASIDDLRKDVERRVLDEAQRDAVMLAALSQMTAVEVSGKLLLTTAAVVAEERAALRAARDLAAGRLTRDITRPASDGLNQHQRAAYSYATSRDGRLKVITGVPGAGKTTLIKDVAAGYAAAGYRVRAVAVANSAVDVLRRETSLPSRSVARELLDLRRQDSAQQGSRLTSRDVVIVDEVSTLGNEQGAALLSAAARAGAVVIAFGDDKQFQSVARGDALRVMQSAVGDRASDLTETRRQAEPWQRDATHAVRRGDVREALEAYKARGFVREMKTQAEARQALVARWSELESQGFEVGIETYTNKERLALNVVAREAYRRLGKLGSEETTLETMDGKTPYAIGDRVVIRESIRGADLFNGSVVTVSGLRGAVVDVSRRDGRVVSIDTREHPGLQHGYASTEFREQGATRYAELQLLTRQVNQRSLTVGMTRHTAEFTAYYSREEFKRGFKGVVQLGERSQRKDLILDGVERGRGDVAFADTLIKGRAPARERGVEMAR